MDTMRNKAIGSSAARRSIFESSVEVQVVRGVDARGCITDDPVALVDGDLLVTLSDGSKEIVVISRNPEADRAMFTA